MTITAFPTRTNGSQPADLPPELAAFIDAAIADKARAAVARRPVIRPGCEVRADHFAIRSARAEERRLRLSADDFPTLCLVLALGVALAVNLFIGFHLTRAVQRTTVLCPVASADTMSGGEAVRKICSRLPQQS